MATCKDCLHDNACTAIFKFYGGDATCNEKNVEKLCRQFHAKSEYQKIRHGKWIMKPHASGFLSPNCSVCHRFNKYHEQTDFCPKCGAIMDLDKNESAQAADSDEALGILNDYRNCHYNAPSGTEEYKLANAINDVLPLLARITVSLKP